MRVMVLSKAAEGMTLGEPTPEALEAFAAMDRFTEELVKAGVFVAAAGLKNDAHSRRIVSDGVNRTVIDGPFAETRELVVGFSIWEVKDMDEAMAWAQRAPIMPGMTGARFAQAIASSISLTSQIEKPAISSRLSANGPSMTVRLAPSETMRLAWASFLRPAAATKTPALTSSSVNRSIAANASSASGVGSPNVIPSVALAKTITRIVSLLV